MHKVSDDHFSISFHLYSAISRISIAMSTFTSCSQTHACIESHHQPAVGAADASGLALTQLVTLLKQTSGHVELRSTT